MRLVADRVVDVHGLVVYGLIEHVGRFSSAHPDAGGTRSAAVRRRPPDSPKGGWFGGIEGLSGLLEPVTYAIEGFDHVEGIFGLLELFSQSLDVAVDGAVININLVVVGGVHQGIATLDHTGPGR